jgi:hypothetical protein
MSYRGVLCYELQRDPLKFNADLKWASERTADDWTSRNDNVSVCVIVRSCVSACVTVFTCVLRCGTTVLYGSGPYQPQRLQECLRYNEYMCTVLCCDMLCATLVSW